VVRLVDDDEVGAALVRAQLDQARQQAGEQLRPLLEADRDQAGHHLRRRPRQRQRHLVDRGRALRVADGDGVPEAAPVAFGIDHRALIAGGHDALDEALGRGRLAATRRAGEEHDLAVGRQRHRLPAGVAAELDGARRRPQRLEVGRDQRVDELAHAGRGAPARDQVGAVAQRRQRVGHGDAALAGGQERVVVLGVAHADGVAWREPERVERGGQAGALVDAAREHHDGALVEDDLQLEPEVVDLLEHVELMRLARGDDDLADAEGSDAALPQPLDQARRRRLTERPRLVRTRQVQQAAVLGDDGVAGGGVGEDAQQVVELAAGDEHHRAPAGAQPAQRGDGGWADPAVIGEGLVVIAGEHAKAHAGNGAARRVPVN
jgi:hypothetical protein